jgi:hypothetical protein
MDIPGHGHISIRVPRFLEFRDGLIPRNARIDTSAATAQLTSRRA